MELRHRGEKTSKGEGLIEDHTDTIVDEITTKSQSLAAPAYNFYDLLYDLASQALQYVWTTFSAYLPFYEPQIGPTVRSRMEHFRRETSLPFLSENSEHEERLMKLWEHAFPGEPLGERKTHKWGRLGFQGRDPATDFRGGGVFALENLLYLAREYPETFQRLVRGEEHVERFPMAITGLNLTMLLFEMLGWGMRATPPSTVAGKRARQNLIRLIFEEEVDGKERHWVFHEVYCVVFDLFDQEWLAVRATTLDFNDVKSKTRQKLETLLSTTSSLQQMKASTRLKNRE